MKMTRAVRYAIGSLVHLARFDGLVSSDKVAAACNCPPKCVLKVLERLARAGVLKAAKGPRGGYSLARPLDRVTLLELAEAVEGPIRGVAPLSSDEGRKPDRCDKVLDRVCKETAILERGHLASVTLADLVNA